MIKPIYLENEHVIIHPFRPEELQRYNQFVNEIQEILSDEKTLHFIPHKRLSTFSQAEGWLKIAILNFHCGRNYIHFITERSSGKLLGMIDIISPGVAEMHYRLEHYPHFIEFYLGGRAKGRKLMSALLPQVINELQQRGIGRLGASVNTQNHAARKVLLHAGFQYHSKFDAGHDLYCQSLTDGLSSIRKAG